MGHHPEAIEELSESIRLLPDRFWHYYNRGMMRAKLGDRRKVTEDFTEAIRLQPEHVDAFYRQGISQAELDKPRVSRLLTRMFSRTKPRD